MLQLTSKKFIMVNTTKLSIYFLYLSFYHDGFCTFIKLNKLFKTSNKGFFKLVNFTLHIVKMQRVSTHCI